MKIDHLYDYCILYYFIIYYAGLLLLYVVVQWRFSRTCLSVTEGKLVGVRHGKAGRKNTQFNP